MRIVPKLTLALVAGTCVILAINGYFRVRREVAFFESDRMRDHEMIGRSLGAAVSAMWTTEGRTAAIKTVNAVNGHFKRIHIRWLDAEQVSEMNIDPEVLAATESGEPVTRFVHNPEPHWYTYVPLDIDSRRAGAIELSEPATSEARFTQSTIVDTVASAGALVLVSAVLAFALGQWLVGGPVAILSDKARRVGHGDFSGPVVLRPRDELADLAKEMNAMSDKLATTLEQLRHADRLATVGKLASGLAHELGTPLNVVSARAGMIASGEATPDEARDYARVIAGASERMTRIIRQLMQFARRTGLQKAQEDVADLCRETMDLLRPLAKKRTVELELVIGTEDTRVSIDAAQVQQVLTNLVMNAMQAMPEGGTVTTSLSDEAVMPPAGMGEVATDCLCLEVRDDGAGIAKEHLPHIFEPFFTTKDVGEGTGLGLAVSYGIIRDHGGWITVDSAPGRGTTFRVHLPRNA